MAALTLISQNRLIDLLTEEIKGDVRIVAGLLFIMFTAFALSIVMDLNEQPMRTRTARTTKIARSIARR